MTWGNSWHWALENYFINSLSAPYPMFRKKHSCRGGKCELNKQLCPMFFFVVVVVFPSFRDISFDLGRLSNSQTASHIVGSL